MAEGRPLPEEAVIGTAQVTYTSGGPITVECIKEEPQELVPFQTEPLLSIQSPPAPTPLLAHNLISGATSLPHVYWTSPDTAFPPLLPRLPLIPENQRLPLIKTPSKWEEAFNVYTFHEQTNKRARKAYENRELTYPSVQRIFVATLQDVRRLTQEGRLATCYLHHMLMYGKFYNYIDSSVRC